MNSPWVWTAPKVLLAVHEVQLADDGDCVLTMLAVASATLDEPAFALWVRGHLAPRA